MDKARRLCMAAVVAASLLTLSPAPAHAGLWKKSIDFFQITPFVGAEVGRIGFAGISPAGAISAGDFVGTGLAWGALAGVRLAIVNLGFLFQRTDLMTLPSDDPIVISKLYFQLGINIPSKFVVFIVHADFGWAYFDLATAPTQQGFGGKLGLALDFYPVRVWSLGIGADFDAQGYVTSSGVLGAYGGTFTFRTGLHF